MRHQVNFKDYDAVPDQKAVTAYLKSKLLLSLRS